MTRWWYLLKLWFAGAFWLASCASVDADRYGITKIEIKGNHALDEAAIKACLISRERPHFSLTLGLSSPACGRPPFNTSAPEWRLWRWPWTDWPAFNEAVFDQDIERVKRFYQARGYYQARVSTVKVVPPEALRPGGVGDCDPARQLCEASILITVDEGLPTRVTELEVRGLAAIPKAQQQQARLSIPLAAGDAVDETRYEQGKVNLTRVLHDAGYVSAEVKGQVQVNTQDRSASVVYQVTPGPLFQFGRVSVKGHGNLQADIISAAAGIPTGARYDPAALKEAQGEVFALGAFSAVQVHETLQAGSHTVDIQLEVTPLGPHALRVSAGVMSGVVRRTSSSELASVPQWDVHLLTSYEGRHLWGSLARLRVEERPRLIFNRDFPRLTTPTFGNIIKLSVSHPGLPEARTTSFFESAWDYGPEPFLEFIRSDIFFRLGSRRRYLGGTLTAVLAAQQDLFLVDPSLDNVSSDGEPQNSYGLSFLEEELRLDLRDNAVRPGGGSYWGLRAAQARRWQGSDWTAYFFSSEARVYLPLWLDLVWASRVAVASTFITDSNPALDPLAQALGPTAYRLRGGGANSNRGFLAGTLGAGLTGGIRRWEASSELRLPIGSDFVLAGFVDLGDASATRTLRFNHLNASVGHGFRYYTVLGAIRLDVGYRLAGLQRADGSTEIEPEAETLWLIGVPGAIHLTIGDAF